MDIKEKNLSIKMGEINTLEVMRDTDYGLFLESKDEDEVLLPNAYVEEADMPIGALIDVFIYTDSEDRPVASTKLPYAQLGEFGYFTVVDYKSYGAFVNWGLPKDLFVPLSQQKAHFTIGQKYILRVSLDEKTNRLYGTQKIGKHFDRDTKGIHQNRAIDMLVIAQTPLGYKVVVDNRYEGMLFTNEIFEDIKVGDRKKGFVKTVRKDGKLDVSLQPIGKNANSQNSNSIILDKLQERGGEINCTYKSDAEDIKSIFGMSKKSYKKSLTSLINDKKIELLDNSIKLI
jgi:hypothetical protein